MTVGEYSRKFRFIGGEKISPGDSEMKTTNGAVPKNTLLVFRSGKTERVFFREFGGILELLLPLLQSFDRRLGIEAQARFEIGF